MKALVVTLALCLGQAGYCLILSQNISISSEGSQPDPSAILDVHSSNKGLLLPRSDTGNIINPANGLLIYDTLDGHFMQFDGTNWTRLIKEKDFRFYYVDRDGDMYGDPFGAMYSIIQLPGYVTDSLDCNDDDSMISPSGIEMCDSIDNNCDGVIDEGDLCGPFEICTEGTCVNCCFNNGGASCAGATFYGNICGENGTGGPIVITGCGDAWYRFTLEECIGGFPTQDLQLTVVLNVPSGMDYDLFLYSPCNNLAGLSTNGGSTTEVINYTITDDFGGDDTTIFYINVNIFSGGECLDWTLTIAGG